jgi:NAD(P)H-hydrate epimerase
MQRIADSSQVVDPDFARWLGQHEVIVDALLGTGAKGAPREPIASMIDAAMKSEAYKVCIDVPSGMDADTGEFGQTIFKADLTVTFHLAKTGHAIGSEAVGEMVVSDIGIPEAAELHAGPGDLLFVRDERDTSSHKGDNGVLLVVGGSSEYHGAPALCGISAVRIGIDLVHLVVPESIREIEAKHSPALIVKSYEGEYLSVDNLPLINDIVERVDAISIGPGLGTELDTLEAVSRLIKTKKPIVIDADGLKSISGGTEALGENVVITPHGGEFKALTGEDLPKDRSARVGAVTKWASKTRCVWTVKGENDIIAQGDRCKINTTGTACMTVGGTGDCLAGAIGAFLARGSDPFRSATAATFILGIAGEIATDEKGCHLLPTDVADKIPEAFKTFA